MSWGVRTVAVFGIVLTGMALPAACGGNVGLSEDDLEQDEADAASPDASLDAKKDSSKDAISDHKKDTAWGKGCVR